MQPKWSICILTVTSREQRFLALADELLSQIGPGGRPVEVVALRNPGGLTMPEVGALRQALLDDAQGEFVSFVDDDDWVERDYVSAVMHALSCAPEPVDFVAFWHAYHRNGFREPRPVVTGLQHGGWYDTPQELVRDITHINPVRTAIARKAGFRATEGAEDYPYDAALRELLKDSRQVEIRRVLYYYFHSDASSVQNGSVPVVEPGPRPAILSPFFRWHPASA